MLRKEKKQSSILGWIQAAPSKRNIENTNFISNSDQRFAEAKEVPTEVFAMSEADPEKDDTTNLNFNSEQEFVESSDVPTEVVASSGVGQEKEDRVSN